MVLAGGTDLDELMVGSSFEEQLASLTSHGLTGESDLMSVLDRAEELQHVDPPGAEQLIAVSSTVAATNALTSVEARAAYLSARIHAERGQLDRALALTEVARDGWTKAGRPVDAMRTQLGRMQILEDLGRQREAVAAGESLLRSLRDIEVPDEDQALLAMVRAAAWGNTGVAYGEIGEHGRSLEAYARSEAAYSALGMPIQVAQQRANRGIELLALGRAREARDDLSAARDAFASHGDPLWAAKCGGELADALSQLGELVEALSELDVAREALARLGATAEEARVVLSLSRAHLAAGLIGEAVSHAQDAAGYFAQSGMVRDTAIARTTAGLALLSLGDLDAAEVEIALAAEALETVGDRQSLARVALVRAEAFIARGRDDRAARALQEAATAMAEGGWLVPLTWVRLRQADVAEDAAAAGHLAAAGALVAELDLPELRYAHRLRVARLHRRRGEDTAAAAVLREAIDAVDGLGRDLCDPAMLVAFRTDKLAAYDELVELLVQIGDPAQVAEAAALADHTKTRTLADLTDGGLARHSIEAAQLVHLRADLSAAYAALVSAPRSTRGDLVRTRVHALERQIAAETRRAALGGSRSAPARDTTPTERPDELDRLDQASREAQAAPSTLTYHVVGEDLVVFASHGPELVSRLLTGAVPRIAVLVDRLTAQWSRLRLGAEFTRRHAEKMVNATDDVLRDLYTALVAPVRDVLDQWGSDRVVVVPHRLLHRVPFHALHDGRAHLMRSWAITVSPTSARELAAAPRLAPDGSGLLLVGAPDRDAPSITREVEALRHRLPQARVLLGEDTTSEALTAAIPGPSYLHLACHGLYRPENPLFSSVRLADRWVTSAEILGLDLRGTVVTLSACESGRSAEHAAEPVGVAWAMLAAGAHGVVVSQWLVDDETTAEFMQHLYDARARDLSLDRSLQQAYAATADHHPHPYHWAPFVFVASPFSTRPAGDAP